MAGGALVHHRQQELHVFLAEIRPLLERARDEGGRRQVRAGPGGEPGDQASLPEAVRGDRGRHREGRPYGDGGAQARRRDVPLHDGAPGFGDLPPRGGGHPQEPADRHRALHGGGVGAGRPYRADEEQGLLGEGAAQAGPGGVPVHPRPQLRARRAQVRRHRRLRLRHRPRERGRAPEGPTLPGHRGRHHQRRHALDEQRQEALLGQAGAAGDHSRDQQGRGPEGGDVRLREDPRLERGSDQPLLRRRLQASGLRPGQGQEAPGRGRLSERLRRGVQGRAAVLLHGALGRGGGEPARQGRDPGHHPAGGVGPVALPGLLPGALPDPRLRHVDHRSRGGLGHRQLREPEVLLPLGQPRLPEALPGVAGHGGRQERGVPST